MAQQLQNITVAAPGFAGLNTQDSPIGLNPAYASIADNCIIDQYGRVGARQGYTLVTTNGASVLGSSRGIEAVFQFIGRDNVTTVYSAGNNKIFTGTTTLTEVTLPVGYTITDNDWKIISFNNGVYFFQSFHAPLFGTAGAPNVPSSKATSGSENDDGAHLPRALMTKRVKKQQQVYFCYGGENLSNKEMMIDYGFAQIHNPADFAGFGWM